MSSTTHQVDSDLNEKQVKAVLWLARRTKSLADAPVKGQRRSYFTTYRVSGWVEQFLDDSKAVRFIGPGHYWHKAANLHIKVNRRRWSVEPGSAEED